MSAPSARSQNLRNVVFVAAPILVAIIVAVIVLSVRGDDSDGAAASTTTAPAATSTTAAPQAGEVAAFCEQTKPVTAVLMEAGSDPNFDPKVGLSAPQVADVVESFDLSGLQPEQLPPAIRADLEYLMEQRESTIALLRNADPATPVFDLLPEELRTRFINVVQFYADNCQS